MPRIGIDARTLTLPRMRGVGRTLADTLRLLPRLRPGWEFILYHQRPLPADNAPPWEQPNVRTCRFDIPGDRFDLWLHVGLPWRAWRDGVDVLHLPAHVAPWRTPLPAVVTVHDLIPLALEDECDATARRGFRRRICRAVRRAAHIVTISNATRDDLERFLHVPPAKVTTIPWGPDQTLAARTAEPLDDARRAALCQKYELDRPWLLVPAGATPRKNTARIVQAWARVSADVRSAYRLVLTGGGPAAVRAQLQQRAAELGVLDSVRVLDFVPAEDMSDLLRAATGLVFPSRYEGFGLPVLDAFICGVPVLTSRVSSLPEVAGDAAVYCNPENVDDIAAGIGRLLDGATADRLRAMGRERLRLFTWEQAAAAWARVFDNVLATRTTTAAPPLAKRAELPS